MLTRTLEILTLTDTETLGRALGTVLRSGDVVRLVGDLGAGKTTLTRAIATAMGADPALVNSPTYVFVNQYPTGEGYPDLAHLDCYRMSGPDDLDTIGWDAVTESGAAILIEWPERIEGSLPADCATITLEHVGETHDSEERHVTIEIPKAWASRPEIAEQFRGEDEQPPRADTVCPGSGVSVPADSPTWPFASERLQMADLYKWFSGQHAITRPMDQRDLEEGVD